MIRPDPEVLLDALDPEQREVATSLGGPVVVIAGAGTGKTRAITHRIAYGVATGAYDATGVLAVTFTKRAAGELGERLLRLGADRVQARTFHAAARRQALYFWPRVYGHELPPVSDGQYGLVAQTAHRLGLPTDKARIRDLCTEVSWSKVSNVLPEAYPALARASGRAVASVEPEQVGRLLQAYEEAKRERGVIDLDDLVLCAVALLSEHEQVAAEVRRTYRHLVVDEYQDVSPVQQRLLDLWRGPSEDLCVVGDAAQTIHTFAGARPDFLTTFAQRHPRATVIRLDRDYRSTPQVVRVANHVMASVPGAVRLRAQRADGPQPTFAEAANEAAEAAAVADWLRGLAETGVSYREMAVLYRINAQSVAYEAALAERGIPYVMRDDERFYERDDVRQALAAARAAARNEPDEPALPAVTTVFSALGWSSEPPEGAGSVRARWEALTALLGIVEEATVEEPGLTLERAVADLQRRADSEHAPAGSGVTLATLHSAKGLEWDAVALVGAQEGSIPYVLATSPEAVAEERRLFYVGVTRARSHLRVSWSRSRTGTGGNRRATRFLDGLVRSSAPAAPRSAAPPHRGSALSSRCRVCSRPLDTAAARTLGRHEDCPSSYDEATYEALRTWRRTRAEADRVPAYVVFTDATLTAIAEAAPTDRAGLLRVNGIGQVKCDKYATEVLAVLAGEDPSGKPSDADAPAAADPSRSAVSRPSPAASPRRRRRTAP